ncbi:MAG: protein export membrane protein [uncultured Solirubrobacteraceae bacterium]|uniref:Protein export membrane protein n=1 Tax=uncultured Solirubrobacteraceae bacterium TaxID=1162706 RepID=A0A6J4TJ85_9ACTN|nr:MAG: protein export membrane protein [uncultured Solirubrobacteraceae bacterium]
MLERVVGFAARRPGRVLAVTVLVTLLCGLAATRLQSSSATDTLVGRSSDSFEATERYYAKFGEDAVFILVRGDLPKLVLTSDLGRLLGLEGCISGNIPAGVTPRGGKDGPCGRLGTDKPVKVVFGPGTFINESVRQLTTELTKQNQEASARSDRAAQAARGLAKEQGRSKAEQDKLAKQARDLVNAEFTKTIVQLALKYGLRGPPRIDDENFVSRLVFDATKAGTPKSRFAYLFPNKQSALIQVRLKPGLSQEERSEAIAQVRRAVQMPDWKLESKAKYVVTGAPVIVNDLAIEIEDSIIVLLIGALLVMAVTLSLVFRARLRLLPLAIALAASALTFGALSLAGASLTMASIAVLPVLIGLAVDYAIQLQSRVEEAGGDVHHMARAGAPTVVTAAAATAAGFMVLLLSPVPMVRGFGFLLVIGIAFALALALVAGTAALSWKPRTSRTLPDQLSSSLRGAGDLLGTAQRGMAQNPASRAIAARASKTGSAAVAFSQRRPERVLAIAAVLAVSGWALDTQTKIESDLTKLVPQNLTALQDLEALQQSTSVGGQLDVVIEADDVADPEVIGWMTRYQKDLLERFGYSEEKGCGKAELCPAFSLPDLFSTPPTSDRQVKALLDVVPPYFSQSVVTPDRRTATMAFGIRLMPLERQYEVMQEMRRRLDPPDGVNAQLAGLPILAAEANEQVSSDWRRLLTLVVGLLAVFVVLRIALRDGRRAAIPLVPILLATGWSSLVLFLLRIPLNPMSVTLGALVIAISTEFSVLLSERYRQERAQGHDPAEAVRRTYRSTGVAVLASGATAIAGFAVLMLSDIRMLRDFGFVTVVDLSVSLLGVLVVLPAVLMLAERNALTQLRFGALRRARSTA